MKELDQIIMRAFAIRKDQMDALKTLPCSKDNMSAFVRRSIDAQIQKEAGADMSHPLLKK